MSPPVISIIVVSYNARDVLTSCLASIERGGDGLDIQTIVIDNASTDGSVEMIRREAPWATVVENAGNVGFAAANNQGIREATGRWLLLLNPDTELAASTLSETLRFAESRPEAGVIGCRCLNPDGSQQSTLFRATTLLDLVVNTVVPNRLMRRSRILGRSRYAGMDLDEVQEVDIVAGCFMFIRREALEQVGGMDDGFFMYGEEAEWCHRFRKAGWKVVYYPGASILHYGGISAAQHPVRMGIEMARSHLLLMQRTRGRAAAYLANLLMLLRDTPRAMLWLLLRSLPVRRLAGASAVLKPSADRWPLHARGLFRVDWAP